MITQSKHNKDVSIDDIEYSHYIAQHKFHEKNQTRTTERNQYWMKYYEKTSSNFK